MMLVVEFDISLRGYDRASVDALVRDIEAAAGDAALIDAAVKRFGDPLVSLRGYDRAQVDAWVAEQRSASAPASTPSLLVVLRGYRIAETDALLATVAAALGSDDPFRRAAVLREITDARLPVAFRGYDRAMVDGYLDEATRELGGGQLR